MLVSHLTPSYMLYSAVLFAVNEGKWYVNSYYSLFIPSLYPSLLVRFAEEGLFF